MSDKSAGLTWAIEFKACDLDHTQFDANSQMFFVANDLMESLNKSYPNHTITFRKISDFESDDGFVQIYVELDGVSQEELEENCAYF